MYYSIVKAKYLNDYKLHVTFEDGKSGVIDLINYTKRKGVFSRFSNIKYFKQLYIDKEFGVLSWPDGLDIAPETIYSKVTEKPSSNWIKQKGEKRTKRLIKKAV